MVILDGFRSFQVVPRFSKYIDVHIKKCSLVGAYPEIFVDRRGQTKYCHNSYAKIIGPKGANYTQYLFITHFELH